MRDRNGNEIMPSDLWHAACREGEREADLYAPKLKVDIATATVCTTFGTFFVIYVTLLLFDLLRLIHIPGGTDAI